MKQTSFISAPYNGSLKNRNREKERKRRERAREGGEEGDWRGTGNCGVHGRQIKMFTGGGE
jgi:hypothetical protein